MEKEFLEDDFESSVFYERDLKLIEEEYLHP